MGCRTLIGRVGVERAVNHQNRGPLRGRLTEICVAVIRRDWTAHEKIRDGACEQGCPGFIHHDLVGNFPSVVILRAADKHEKWQGRDRLRKAVQSIDPVL